MFLGFWLALRCEQPTGDPGRSPWPLHHYRDPQRPIRGATAPPKWAATAARMGAPQRPPHTKKPPLVLPHFCRYQGRWHTTTQVRNGGVPQDTGVTRAVRWEGPARSHNHTTTRTQTAKNRDERTQLPSVCARLCRPRRASRQLCALSRPSCQPTGLVPREISLQSVGPLPNALCR